MKLVYDLSHIEDFDLVCFLYNEGKSTMHPKTERIIALTQFLGVPQITNETALDFYERAVTYRAVYGGPPITEDEVKMHVGLTTNARYLKREIFFSSIGRAGFSASLGGQFGELRKIKTEKEPVKTEAKRLRKQLRDETPDPEPPKKEKPKDPPKDKEPKEKDDKKKPKN